MIYPCRIVQTTMPGRGHAYAAPLLLVDDDDVLDDDLLQENRAHSESVPFVQEPSRKRSHSHAVYDEPPIDRARKNRKRCKNNGRALAHASAAPPALSVWRRISATVASIEESVAAASARETSLVTLEDFYNSQSIDSASTLVNDGDKRLARVLELLDSFHLTPTSGQRKFLNAFVDAVLPLVYGTCWDGSMMRVLRERRLKRVISEVLVIASRQIGKTNSIAMFCAAMLLAVPGIRIGVYSTGTRASSHVSETVLRMLQDIPGADRRIIKNSKECVYVAEHQLPPGVGVGSPYAKLLESDAGTSQLMSYPDNATGTCACGCGVCYVGGTWFWLFLHIYRFSSACRSIQSRQKFQYINR